MSNAKNMTNKERAVKAVQERWHPTVTRATHSGVLNIAGQEIACDVLEDGRRVLRKKNFLKALGRTDRPSKDVNDRAIQANVPVFVSANNLTPYLKDDFNTCALEVIYKSCDGTKQKGYEAKILPETCEVYLKAREDGVLIKSQMHLAHCCEIMMRSLAKVGVLALIDECTGYQEVRERNELQLILEKYISEELREWTKKFPNEFFKQIYRLHGWEYPRKTNHPQYVGKIINSYIYEKLPQGILEELKKKNPINQNGIRNHRHHQFLTEDIGESNLNKQIFKVITLMKVSRSMDEFKEFMERIE